MWSVIHRLSLEWTDRTVHLSTLSTISNLIDGCWSSLEWTPKTVSTIGSLMDGCWPSLDRIAKTFSIISNLIDGCGHHLIQQLNS